jgi:hypothetical protein
MNQDRLRVWVVIFAGISILLVSGILPQLGRCGKVEGTVIYNGRPLRNCMVIFQPEDIKHSGNMFTSTDEQGHFDCDPAWERDRRGRMRYQVLIVLGTQNLPPQPGPGDAGTALAGRGILGIVPERGGESGPNPRVVLTSLSTQEAAPTVRDIAPAGRPGHQPKDVVQVEVWLGPEPAQIDFDVRD